MTDNFHRARFAGQNQGVKPALFVDRDGTLIADPGYLSDPAGVHLLPHAARALQRFSQAGYLIVLVTNQSGVGRGYFTWEAYDAVADVLRQQLAQLGVVLDAELACGHAPGTEVSCDWRKPGPGMIKHAASTLLIDVAASVMVGDKLSDLQAGAAAGVGRLVCVSTQDGAFEVGRVKSSGLIVEMLSDLSTLSPCAS